MSTLVPEVELTKSLTPKKLAGGGGKLGDRQSTPAVGSVTDVPAGTETQGVEQDGPTQGLGL